MNEKKMNDIYKRRFQVIHHFIVCGLQEIVLGDAEIVVAGGSENMSQAPYAIRNARFGINLGEGREVQILLAV